LFGYGPYAIVWVSKREREVRVPTIGSIVAPLMRGL
jgi:hypothetical protein